MPSSSIQEPRRRLGDRVRPAKLEFPIARASKLCSMCAGASLNYFSAIGPSLDSRSSSDKTHTPIGWIYSASRDCTWQACLRSHGLELYPYARQLRGGVQVSQEKLIIMAFHSESTSLWIQPYANSTSSWLQPYANSTCSASAVRRCGILGFSRMHEQCNLPCWYLVLAALSEPISTIEMTASYERCWGCGRCAWLVADELKSPYYASSRSPRGPTVLFCVCGLSPHVLGEIFTDMIW